jgi:hypothetical protein
MSNRVRLAALTLLPALGTPAEPDWIRSTDRTDGTI